MLVFRTEPPAAMSETYKIADRLGVRLHNHQYAKHGGVIPLPAHESANKPSKALTTYWSLTRRYCE